MQFFSKLSQKQILAIFASLFIVLLILILVVFQVINSQKTGLFVDSKQNSSTSDSSPISANSNNSSSSIFSSNSSLTSNSSDNSSLSNSQANSNSNSLKSPTLSNETGNQTGNSKFIGKIGNSEIEMSLNFEGTGTEISGNYFYKSQNKPIQLKGNYSISGSGSYGDWYLEEFVEGEKSGTFKTKEGSGFYSKVPEKTNLISGEWINAKTGEKLDFYVERVGSDAKADSYYQYQETEPMLSLECQEGLKTLNNSDPKSKDNQIIINLNLDEQIIGYRCDMGAYQGTYNFNYINKKTSERKPLRLQYYDIEGKNANQTTEDICLRSHIWNSTNKTLEIFCSGRGLGDCGSEYIYKWEERGGYFDLITAKYQEECILDKPENQNKTEQEIEEIMQNLQFPIVYQK